MELKDFIKHTLVSIAEGVTEAREEVKDKLSIIPAKVNKKSVTQKNYVNFDIAVTISDELQKKSGLGSTVKAGIQVFAASIGVSHGSSHSSKQEGVNRIAFKVPIFYGVKNKKLRK